MVTYQPLIPSGTIKLNVDYQNIQDNFNQANVVYGTDHYPFDNASSNEGFHDKVTLPNSSDPVTKAGQGIVYTKDSAIEPGRTDLYYAYQTNVGTPLTGTFFPLTACKAFGMANTSGLVAGTSFNVDSCAFSGSMWTLILNSEPHSDKDKIMVFTSTYSSSGASTVGVSVTDTKTFSITRGGSNVSQIAFQVWAI